MNLFAKRRIEANLRQEEVAKALHVDRSTVAKWETGVAKPRAEKLPSIARLYRCTVGELLYNDESASSVEKVV